MHFANFGAWFDFVGLAAEAWSFIRCDADTANASTQSWLGKVSFLHNWRADGSITRLQGLVLVCWCSCETILNMRKRKIIPVLRNYMSDLGLFFVFCFSFGFFSSPLFEFFFFFFAFSDSFCEGIILLYLPCYFHKSLLLTQASQLTGKNSKKESNIEKIRWLCAILSFLVYTFCTIFIFSC